MAELRSVVILYAVVCSVYLVYGATRSQTFYSHNGKHCVNKSSSLTTQSDVACCQACVETDTCTLVSFDKVAKTCEISEIDIESTDALVVEKGWNVYYKKNLGCLPDWVAYENSCLYLDTELKNRSTALSRCVSLEQSAHLVDITTEAKQLFISGWLQTESPDTWLWLGGMYDVGTGQYHWSDGTPFGYTSWSNGEPNNLYVEWNCVGAVHSMKYYWFDLPCDFTLYGVCEFTLI